MSFCTPVYCKEAGLSALVVVVSAGILLKDPFASFIRNDSGCVICAPQGVDVVSVTWPPGLAAVVTVLRSSSMFVWAPPICSISLIVDRRARISDILLSLHSPTFNIETKSCSNFNKN